MTNFYYAKKSTEISIEYVRFDGRDKRDRFVLMSSAQAISGDAARKLRLCWRTAIKKFDVVTGNTYYCCDVPLDKDAK